MSYNVTAAVRILFMQLLPGLLLILAAEFGVSGEASVDDLHLGVIEYEIACMSCHGVEGRGDGKLAKNLKTAPANLTQITGSSL